MLLLLLLLVVVIWRRVVLMSLLPPLWHSWCCAKERRAGWWHQPVQKPENNKRSVCQRKVAPTCNALRSDSVPIPILLDMSPDKFKLRAHWIAWNKVYVVYIVRQEYATDALRSVSPLEKQHVCD